MRKEKTDTKTKRIVELPPKELIDIFNKIQIFPTLRLAREMWGMSEKILKKEKLWPHFYNSWKKSTLEFDVLEDYYEMCHIKKNEEEDYLDIIHLVFEEGWEVKTEGTFFVREIDYEKDIFSIQILKKERGMEPILHYHRLQP